MILRKSRSLLFHYYQKQAHKIGDFNKGTIFERLMDRYTNQQTHGRMCGRKAGQGEKQRMDVQ